MMDILPNLILKQWKKSLRGENQIKSSTQLGIKSPSLLKNSKIEQKFY